MQGVISWYCKLGKETGARNPVSGGGVFGLFDFGK